MPLSFTITSCNLAVMVTVKARETPWDGWHAAKLCDALRAAGIAIYREYGEEAEFTFVVKPMGEQESRALDDECEKPVGRKQRPWKTTLVGKP